MGIVNQPEDLGSILGSIERRLRALETAPRLTVSSIANETGDVVVKLGRQDDGSYSLRFFDAATGAKLLDLSAEGLQVFDATGGRVLEIGKYLSADTTVWGIRVEDPALPVDFNDLFTVNSEEKFGRPWLGAYWHDLNETKVTTSSSFESLWQTSLAQPSALGLLTHVTVSAPSGTTAEVRLQISAHAPSPEAGPAVSFDPGGANESKLVKFTTASAEHETDDVLVIVDVQARRTAGAGNVTVHRPRCLAMGSKLRIDHIAP